MQGAIGEFVSIVGPQTEADPAVLVTGVLTGFGNAAGGECGFTIEGTQHGTNLFTVFVGETSKARKGTGSDNILKLFKSIDPEWAETQVQTGLSSGEGLIAAAAGTADQRLLFIEDEFTALLRVMSRPRNILSTTLRRGFDHKNLQIATKTNPILVTGAHISLIGHSTLYDLERFLDVCDVVNGFANRILWVLTRRSKMLPFGGSVSASDTKRIAKRIKSALRFAARAGDVGFSRKAAELWVQKYPELTADRDGLVGAATSRAEALTRRVATVYALMDESETVLVQHLRAALEVWRYCDESARLIFGRRQRTTLQNQIAKMIQRGNKKGVTRTEISAAFNRHRSSSEISDALERLKESGLIKPRKIKTDGRPTESWFWLKQ